MGWSLAGTYVPRDVDCDIETLSVNSRLSSANSARIYNHTFAYRNPHIMNNKLAFATYHSSDTSSMYGPKWDYPLFIRDKDVLNGFFLYALLLEKAEHQSVLVLPHNESTQSDRLKQALAERNARMEGPGQEAYTHACDDCYDMKIENDEISMYIYCCLCTSLMF